MSGSTSFQNIDAFVAKPDEYVLRCTKGPKGQIITAERRGVITWLDAHFLDSNSYKLETISNALAQCKLSELPSNFITALGQVVDKFENTHPESHKDIQYIYDLTHKQKSDFDVSLTPQQQALLSNIINSKVTAEEKRQYTVLPGGIHDVFILNSAPNIVFKRMKGAGEERIKNQIDDELAVYKNGQKIAVEHSLDLIRIPKCCKYELDINGKKSYLLAQEMLPCKGDHTFQKGFYRYAFENSQTSKFIASSLSQLVKFICLTGFSDVKFNNIPLLDDLQGVGLYDLDSGKSVDGLFYSKSYDGKGGALSYSLNEKMYNDLIHEVRDTLKGDSGKLEAFEQELELNDFKIKNSIKKRLYKRNSFKEYLNKKNITSAQQGLSMNSHHLSRCPKIAFLEQQLIAEINSTLKAQAQAMKNPDLLEARRLTCDFHTTLNTCRQNELFKDMKREEIKDLIKACLEQLVSKEGIHSFSIKQNDFIIRI